MMNKQTTEVLLILQEECAEVTQAISKCFRFGFDGKKDSDEKSNIEKLQEELGDVMAMIELLVDQKVGVEHINITKAKAAKFEKLKKWSTIYSNK